MEKGLPLPEGMIFDQRAYAGDAYGLRGSDRNGCGWIAAYNVLRLLGRPVPADQVRREMEKYLLLGGLNGTPFYALLLYFRAKGFRTALCWRKHSFHRQALRHPASILFYLYRWGGHFAVLRPLPDGRCHFFNDVYGEMQDFRSMRTFLSDHRTGLPMLLISIDP